MTEEQEQELVLVPKALLEEVLHEADLNSDLAQNEYSSSDAQDQEFMEERQRIAMLLASAQKPADLIEAQAAHARGCGPKAKGRSA